MVKAKTHPDRGILDRGLIPLDTSLKEANGTHRLISSTETNERPRATATQMMTLQWQPEECFCKLTREPWTRWRGWRGREVNGSSMAWLDPNKYLYMEKSCVTHKIKPITHPYRSHMKRYPKILKTLSAKPSQQGKIPTLKGFWFTTHYYISTRPPLFSSMHKIPSSLTIEFLETSHSLTWPSEGSWLVQHRCLLFSPFVLIPQVPIGVIWSLKLTNDFSTSSHPKLCP